MPTLPAHPSSSRRAALAGCIVLAALLNAAGLGIASQMTAPALPAATQTSAPPVRTRIVLLTHTPHAAETRTPRATISPAALPRTPAAPATPVPRRTTPWPELAMATSAPARAPALADDRPLRLYGFDEVDVPAEPVDDWALDVTALDDAGVTRLVFELLVDERGSVIGCTVLDPSGLDASVRSALEQRLAATQLRPAERGGRVVASVRRIVMQVADAI